MKLKMNTLDCIIACCIIFLNIMQIGVSGFGYSINMNYLNIILVIILIVLKKMRFVNKKLIIILFITMLLFGLNFVFNDSYMLGVDFKGFLIYVLPIVVVFLFDYDIDNFSYVFLYFCIGISILYLFNIILKTALINDYMTLGYYGMFCTTYVLIYGIIKNKKILSIFSIILSVMFFIYGSRGSILLLLTAMILIIFNRNMKTRWKVIAVLALVLFYSFGQTFLINTLENIYNLLDGKVYSIKNIIYMLNNNSIEDKLGGRFDIYQNAFYELKENLILGMGISSFQMKYGYFVHNIFLDVFVTFGIFGGLVYFGFLLLIIKNTLKISKKSDNIRIFTYFCIAICTKLLLSKTFINDSYIWLLIGMFTSFITTEVKNKNEE